MRRWTFTLFLGLSAAAAIALAPRLFGRVPEGGPPPEPERNEVVAELQEGDPEAARVEWTPPTVPEPVAVPPRPVRVLAEPGVHPIHTRHTDTDTMIPELAEPVRAVPAVPDVPVVPDAFWPPLPACGMG